MTRRGRTVPSLTVRVSHEATRLSQAHVAAAFERLVPVLERQTRLGFIRKQVLGLAACLVAWCSSIRRGRRRG